MQFPPASKQRFPTPSERVVITGLGIITPLGRGWDANAQGFRTGRVAVRPVSLFDVSRQRAKVAAEIDLTDELPRAGLTRREQTRIHRAAHLLLLAAEEAWQQSGWSSGGKLPIVLGTTSGEMCLGQEYLCHALQSPRSFKRQASRVAHYLVQQNGITLGHSLGVSANLITISNACASGANALGHAWGLVRSGRAERVLTGGYDALCHLTFAGFDSLQALAPGPCRPFGADRDGLNLGEGAAVFALESLTRARARGAEVLGEIAGYGASMDTHHLTQPDPAGTAARAAMEAACASAGITPERVDYLNAHGTATPHNDAAETAAINAWAGARAASLPVSSTKAGIGHLLGAAGAVEAAACVMALRGQWLPPQTYGGETDAACRFSVVRKAGDASLETALSNSIGFGGSNASLVLRRWG